MANTRIRLFKTIQKVYEQSGVAPSRSDPSSKALNWKNVSILCILIQFGLSSIGFCLFKANSIGQRADSFYMFLSVCTCTSFLSIAISKIGDIQKLIENCEEFIEKSKKIKLKLNEQKYCNRNFWIQGHLVRLQDIFTWKLTRESKECQCSSIFSSSKQRLLDCFYLSCW